MRLTAPPHTTSIDLARGSFPVVNGVVEVPDDLGPGDMAGLAVNGFVRVNDAPATAKPQPAKVAPPAAPVAEADATAAEPNGDKADDKAKG